MIDLIMHEIEVGRRIHYLYHYEAKVYKSRERLLQDSDKIVYWPDGVERFLEEAERNRREPEKNGRDEMRPMRVLTIVRHESRKGFLLGATTKHVGWIKPPPEYEDSISFTVAMAQPCNEWSDTLYRKPEIVVGWSYVK